MIIGNSYADDADDACKQFDIDSKAVRAKPSFLNDGPTGCRSLQPRGSMIDSMCFNLVPQGLDENCGVNYYEKDSSQAVTVLSCSAGDVSEPENKVLFKYVLCKNKVSSEYKWILMYNGNDYKFLPQSFLSDK